MISFIMKIRNPLNGKYDYTLLTDDPNSIAGRTGQLRQAQRTWGTAGVQHRAAVVTRWMEAFAHYETKIADQLAIDTGRRRIARLETAAILQLLRAWTQRAPQLLTPAPERPSFSEPSVRIRQQWVSYPVVGVVSPWNFPLLLALIDTIPALLAGSAVLLKPSEVTPRFMDPLEESIQAVPELAKVFQLVRGGPAVGKAVVQHADAICFTGSVPTGKAIAAVCAARFVPAFLELGGKDPAIVLDDADLDISTDAVLRSAAGVAGQACQSLERVYVDATIYDNFVERITAKAAAVRLDTQADDTGEIGPLIFAPQAEKIARQLDEAVARGARIRTGGTIETINGGLYLRPTVVTGVDHSMALMTEETFGPVIPIRSFPSEQVAIELANDSHYGLSAAVFSSNRERALRVAQQLDAGAISINDGGLTNKVYDAEKNSFKQSGLYASRMGDAGFLRFFRKKALLIQTARPQTLREQVRQ